MARKGLRELLAAGFAAETAPAAQRAERRPGRRSPSRNGCQADRHRKDFRVRSSGRRSPDWRTAQSDSRTSRSVGRTTESGASDTRWHEPAIKGLAVHLGILRPVNNWPANPLYSQPNCWVIG